MAKHKNERQVVVEDFSDESSMMVGEIIDETKVATKNDESMFDDDDIDDGVPARAMGKSQEQQKNRNKPKQYLEPGRKCACEHVREVHLKTETNETPCSKCDCDQYFNVQAVQLAARKKIPNAMTKSEVDAMAAIP